MIGLDQDLVQMMPVPPNKGKTNRLMQLADMLVVTGSQNNVKAGYSSGTPALGVGQGNVVTIIDETASQLAGGAASLLALSRALLANPKVLLLDEFADSLDIDTRIKLQDNFSIIEIQERTLPHTLINKSLLRSIA